MVKAPRCRRRLHSRIAPLPPPVSMRVALPPALCLPFITVPCASPPPPLPPPCPPPPSITVLLPSSSPRTAAPPDPHSPPAPKGQELEVAHTFFQKSVERGAEMFDDTADNMTGIVVYLNPKGTKAIERNPSTPTPSAKGRREDASKFSV